MPTTKPGNPTAGSAEPSWFEWKTGLQQLVELLDEDADIVAVAFQLHSTKGWDDVGVRFRSGRTRLLQAKHSRTGERLTFGDLVYPDEGGSSLLRSLAEAWKSESESRTDFECALVTNRSAGVNWHGDRPPLEEFLPKLRSRVERATSLTEITWSGEDPRYQKAWEVFSAELGSLGDTEKLLFLKSLSIDTSAPGLAELEGFIRNRIAVLTGLPPSSVNSLFNALVANLRKWACHSQREREWITREELRAALACDEDTPAWLGHCEVETPEPFFPSRNATVDSLRASLLSTSGHRVDFLAAEPGAGKTSCVSKLSRSSALLWKEQCVSVRFYAYRPIRPGEPDVGSDSGAGVLPETLWLGLLWQIRDHLRKTRLLADLRVPVWLDGMKWETARDHVLRIGESLGSSWGRPFVVCIDGIDHAARAKRRGMREFLQTLPSPDAIPSHMRFLLGGQPSDAYSEYPFFLRQDHPAVRVHPLGTLTDDDLRMLWRAAKPTLPAQSESPVIRLLAEKAQRRTLPTVYAVEDIRSAASLDDVERILDSRPLVDSLHTYYDEIWKAATGSAADEPRLAALFVLLRERPTGELLASAFHESKKSAAEWADVLRRFRPLVRETEQGFEILHNDLRVHLDARLAAEPFARRGVASALVNHYRKPTSNRLAAHLSLLNLLRTADRAAEFADDFTTDWVIEAASLDLTGENLSTECSAAFAAASDRKNWLTLHSVACASLTLNRVRECIKNSGRCTDLSESKSAPAFLPVEDAPLPLELWNGSEFAEIIEACESLIDCGETVRARLVLKQWVGAISMDALAGRLAMLNKEADEGRMRGSVQKADVERFGKICGLCQLPLTFGKDTPKAHSGYRASIETGWALGLAQLPKRRAALRVWCSSYPNYLAAWVTAVEGAAGRNRWGEVRAFLTRLAKCADLIDPKDRLLLGWHAARAGEMADSTWKQPLSLPRYGLPEGRVSLQTLIAMAQWIAYTEPLREPTQIAEDLASLLDSRKYKEEHTGVRLTLSAGAVLGRILRRVDRKLPEDAPLTVLPQTIEDLLNTLWCKLLPDRDMPHDEFRTPSDVGALLARAAWDCRSPYRDILLRIGKERFEEVMLWKDGKGVFEILWEGGERSFLTQTVRAKATHISATLHEEDPNTRADVVASLLHFTRRLNLSEETHKLKARLQTTRAGYVSDKDWVFEPLTRWFSAVRKRSPFVWRKEGAQLLSLETICERQGGDNNYSHAVMAELGASAIQCGPRDVSALFTLLTTGSSKQPLWNSARAVTGGVEICLAESRELGEEAVLSLSSLAIALGRWPRGSPVSTLHKILSAQNASPDAARRPEWQKAINLAADIQGITSHIEPGAKRGEEETKTQDARSAEQILKDIVEPPESSWNRIRDVAALAEKARAEHHPKRDEFVAEALSSLRTAEALSRYVELRDTDLMNRLHRNLSESEMWQLIKELTAIVGEGRNDLSDPIWAFAVAFMTADLACWARAEEDGADFALSMLRQLLEMHWKWHGIPPPAAEGGFDNGGETTWAESTQRALLFLTQTDACETLYMAMCGIRFFAEAFPRRIPEICREGLKCESAKDAVLALSQLWATRHPSALAPALADLKAAQSTGILDDRLEAWAACGLRSLATDAQPEPFVLPGREQTPEIAFPGDGSLFEAEAHMIGLLRINSFARMANERLRRTGRVLGPMEKAFRHMARTVMRGEVEFPLLHLPPPTRLASSNSSPRARHEAERIVGEAILYQCQGETWSPPRAAAVRLCMGLGMEPWIVSAPPNVWPEKKSWPDDFEVERWIDAGASPAHEVSQLITALLEGHELDPSLILLGSVLHIPTYRRDLEFRFWLSKVTKSGAARKTGTPAGRTLAGWLAGWSFASSQEVVETSVHFVGTLVNYPHGSCDLTPTNKWTENWHWTLDPSNCLRFNSTDGAKVAWFERWIAPEASQNRGAWRQALLSRWVARREGFPREAGELRDWRKERDMESGLLARPE